MTRLDSYAAILVAAGLSSRFGAEDKLLAEIDGAPLLSWSLRPLLEAGLGDIVIVTGANDKAVRELCAGHSITFANNPAPAAGLGASIAVGAGAVQDHAKGVFVCLGDMPFVPGAVLRELAELLRGDEDADAAAPFYKGQRGHPVLFRGRHLAALKALSGDEGAKHVLTAPGFRLHRLEKDDEGVVLDVDRREDLSGRAVRRLPSGE